MSDLPPDLALEPEPTDADPPPEAIRPDRPRIWPEEPRAPRPQIKRPMEEWLAEFEERVKQQGSQARDQVIRRRRPRGLARILPAVPVQRPERTRAGGVSQQQQPAQPATEPRRGRRRRRGSGRGQQFRAPSQRETPGAQAEGQPAVSPRPARPPRPRGNRPPRPGRTREPGGNPSQSSGNAPGPSGDQIQRRRRRRGRGRGRGRGGPGGPPNSGGAPAPE